MTKIQWKQLEETVSQMTSVEKERLAVLLDCSHDEGSFSAGDPLLGLMANDSELVDQVVQEAHSARESDPLRSD